MLCSSRNSPRWRGFDRSDRAVDPTRLGNADYETSINPELLVARNILGFLLTAFAISLGAPFWSDMLQNIANLRSAGPKPARSAPNATT